MNARKSIILALVACLLVLQASGKSILNDEQSMGSVQDGEGPPSHGTSDLSEGQYERVYLPALNRMPRWALVPTDDISNTVNSNRILAMLRHPFQRLNAFSRKRSACVINAGMTAGCDFKDFIQSHKARLLYESAAGPGKRSAELNSPPLLAADDIDSDLDRLPPQYEPAMLKRMECLSGLPGGDCENSFLGSESLGQDFLRPGGRNPGRR